MIRLNVQCFGAFWVATVQLALNAYIVPDGAMAYEILWGTDSWARLPVREYKEITGTRWANRKPLQHFKVRNTNKYLTSLCRMPPKI